MQSIATSVYGKFKRLRKSPNETCSLEKILSSFLVYFFWRARMCLPLLRLCRPFMTFEGCLDSNPECCRPIRSSRFPFRRYANFFFQYYIKIFFQMYAAEINNLPRISHKIRLLWSEEYKKIRKLSKTLHIGFQETRYKNFHAFLLSMSSFITVYNEQDFLSHKCTLFHST